MTSALTAASAHPPNPTAALLVTLHPRQPHRSGHAAPYLSPRTENSSVEPLSLPYRHVCTEYDTGATHRMGVALLTTSMLLLAGGACGRGCDYRA